LRATESDPPLPVLAGEKVGVPPERCIVVEDSLVGLRAAKGAGMKCIITYPDSTSDCDFYGEVEPTTFTMNPPLLESLQKNACEK
jgi:beta-phosphoglucomutase-like phosphatase (HAD superfamily)